MARQTGLDLYKGKHGGRREGSGRKRIHSPGVAHRTRERVNMRTPAHVNFKLKAQIRNKACLKILKRAILNSRKKGLRVVHYSLQSNHVHLIVEAGDSATLTTGMRSLTVTFAKGLRRGRVQLERYHLHVLRTLREAKNAIRYVLLNRQRHTGAKTVEVDGYASWENLAETWIGRFLEGQGLGRVGSVEAAMGLDGPVSWVLRRGTEILA